MHARFRSLLAPLVLAVAASSCAGSGGRVMRAPESPAGPASADPVRAALEGEWRLVAMQAADGGSRKVTGFLRYDRFANLTMRAELAADEPAARAPQNVVAAFTAKATPAGGAFDYTGLSEDVGRERLLPDAVDMNEWRYFEIDGPSLRVFVRDRAGRPAATLLFQRGQ